MGGDSGVRSLNFVRFTPVIILFAASACGRPNPDARDTSSQTTPRDVATIGAEILAADQQYGAAWLKGDWAAASALTAPNYYGVSTDFELDQAGLKEIFPKVKAFGYEKQAPHVRVFSPSLAIVSYEMTMKETYDGRDISGRYWYATTWTLIDGSWKLLMEQEIPLDVPKQSSN
jgi:hypothetical protein